MSSNAETNVRLVPCAVSAPEGAANKDWDFSVRAVDRSDNASAGSRLKLSVLHERILCWDANLPGPQTSNDAYWVTIRYSTG